jgi:hypothetical protein
MFTLNAALGRQVHADRVAAPDRSRAARAALDFINDAKPST